MYSFTARQLDCMTLMIFRNVGQFLSIFSSFAEGQGVKLKHVIK